MPTTLRINGQTHSVEAEPGTPLLWVIRDDLKLTGTKFGCGVASCGACTVHIDGEPVRSCQTFIEDVDGAEITTIEGLDSKAAKAVQAVGLLSENPKPSVQEIEDFMHGNACRCATYQHIRAAVVRASEIMEA